MNLANEAWGWLRRELDAWADNDLQADFWWRDDDAADASPQLERLLQLGERHRVALSLAAIPALLRPQLAEALQGHSRVAVLQHGYSHRSNAAPGERKLELGGIHDHQQVVDDLVRGRQVLQRHLGERFQAVLVPPWNRIDHSILQALPALGYVGISTMRVRRGAWPVPGLLRVNAHLDPVNWRHTRGFIGLYPAVAILVQHLAARRTGYRDFDEPTGILSHHLVQNDSVWRFLDELFEFLGNHPACRWTDSASIWQID